MKKIKLHTTYRQLLADTLTPVGIYQQVRDRFAGSILLESTDYHGQENSYSYICCDPFAQLTIDKGQVEILLPYQEKIKRLLGAKTAVEELENFKSSFKVEASPFKFATNGLFGYMSYGAIQYFEDLILEKSQSDIPDLCYKIFRYVIVFDHFSNKLYAFEHSTENDKTNDIDALLDLFKRNSPKPFPFRCINGESSNMKDSDFLDMVQKGIAHCLRGDVFQMVLSRQFSTAFSGDEFKVYRALRSINPSPYLFYFDFGNFRLFGSSPEAQIIIKNGTAGIYPIAGTFKRSGNDEEDALLAQQLSADEKENAEHVMLVDLARNDLSRSATKVQVEVFKETQFYSHVIHLVSKVTGQIGPKTPILQLAADTFPAGTLSGAPKYKAMQLIDRYEPTARGFYGGAIGFIGFNGDFNHAILIRSFLSQQSKLYYQAGAGVVAKSNPENELQEVRNKLGALRAALTLAEKI